MRKIKLLLLFFVCMMITPLVHAQCSYEREAELSKIASNVQFSYSYEVKKNVPFFTVNIVNIIDDIYITDNYGNTFSGKNEFNVDYKYRNSINYIIYSNDYNCRGEKILSKSLKIPVFNDYASYPECKDNPEFKLCGLWFDSKSYAYSDFLHDLDLYKHKNEKIISNNNQDSKGSLLNLLYGHKFYVLGILTIVIILVILIVFRRFKK